MNGNEEEHNTEEATAPEAQRIDPDADTAAMTPPPSADQLDARQEAISKKRRKGGPELEELEEPEGDAAAAPMDVDQTEVKR